MIDSLQTVLAGLTETDSSIICRHPHGATRVYPKVFEVSRDVSISAEVEVEGDAAGCVTLTPNLTDRVSGWQCRRRNVARRVAEYLGVVLEGDGAQRWQRDGYEITYEEAWGDFSFAVAPLR